MRYGNAPPQLVGRAGFFVRRAVKPALLRLDVSYQAGTIAGALQHDIVVRIGFGSY